MTDNSRDLSLKYIQAIDKALECLIFVLLILTALLFNRTAAGAFLTPKSRFFQLGVSLGLALWAARTALSGRIGLTRTPLNLPLFLLLILAALSSFLAPYPALSRLDLTYIALALILYFIITEIIQGKDQIRSILFVLIGLSGVVALYGICQYHHMDFIHDWVERKHMFSTLGNPNFLAQYLICVLPVSFVMVLTGRRFESLLCGLSFFLSCWALLLTQTRAAWAGALFSFFILAVLFVMKDRPFLRAKKKVLLILPAVLLAIAILFVGLNRVRQQTEATDALVQRIKTSPRDPFREFVWRAGWRMFLDHPVFGVGLGNFRVFYPDYQTSILSGQEKPSLIIDTYVRRAHNEYLQAALEFGLPGLLLVFWLIIALIRHGLRVYRSIHDPGGKRIAAALLSGCLALLVNAFFSFPFHLASTGTVFICLAALITSTGRAFDAPLRRKGIDSAWLRSGLVSWSVILVFLTLSLFMSADAVGCFIADVYLKRGYDLVNENKLLDQAQAMLTRGIRLNPADGQFYFALGSVRHKKGDTVRAIGELRRALETFRDANVFHSLGTVYMINGDRDKAVDMWGKAVGIRPDLSDSLLCLGLASLEVKAINEAQKYLAEAAGYDPDYGAAHYMLGHIYMLQRRPMKAVESWDTFLALERKQERRDALHFLSLASLKKGGFLDQLQVSWPEALGIEPDNEPLKDMVERFQTLAASGKF